MDTKDTRSLKIKFGTANGKSRTISFKDCADEISAENVKKFADIIVDNKVVVYDDDDYIAKLNSASIITVTEEPVNIA